MSETNKNVQVVLFGDSTGCAYRMKIRANTYSLLLSRRLNKVHSSDYTAGATSSTVLQMLSTDEEKIEHLKTAEIIMLCVGGNNINVPILLAMIRCFDLGPLGVRTLSSIAVKFNENPLSAAAKVVKEIASRQTKEEVGASIDNFKREFPLVIKKLKSINPNAILMVQTVYNIFYTTPDKMYHSIGKPLNKYFDAVNECMYQYQDEYDYIVVDLDKRFKAYKGKEELTTIKIKDMHLTDFGHLFTYRSYYEELIKRYPEYNCEEDPAIIKTLETMTEEELEEQRRSNALSKATASSTVNSDFSKYVQPDDFILGPNNEYNDWFSTEVTGTKYYPLKILPFTPCASLDGLKIKDLVILKLNEDKKVGAYDIEGNLFGILADEEEEPDRVTVTFGLENRFGVFAKIVTLGDDPKIIFAVHPSREYYNACVDKKEAAAKASADKN